MSQIRCKDSAKNRFSEEKENRLSFLSVRFLFKSKTKQNKKAFFYFFCWDAAYLIKRYIIYHDQPHKSSIISHKKLAIAWWAPLLINNVRRTCVAWWTPLLINNVWIIRVPLHHPPADIHLWHLWIYFFSFNSRLICGNSRSSKQSACGPPYPLRDTDLFPVPIL